MSFLLFGSLWFWVVAVIAIILIVVATETGSGYGATATLLITMALLFFFGNKVPFSSFFSYVSSHPWLSLAFVAGYILCGAGWSIVKWYFFLIKSRDKCREEIASSRFPLVRTPKVSDHKAEIMAWMLYWPFSTVWTVLDHPLKRIFLFIYSKIKASMQTLADKVYEPLTEQQKTVEAEVERRRRIRSGEESSHTT